MYNQKTVNAWAEESGEKDIPYLEIGMCFNQQYPEGDNITLGDLVKIAKETVKSFH